MIAEIIPRVYDVTGRPVGAPVTRKRKRLFWGTFPTARYVSQPLVTQCLDITEMRRFLSKCKYVSDQEQFGRRDYWMPPEEFEEKKKGDCDDFALWTWRQLMGMGYRSRYVVGQAGKYGSGHAWVTIEENGKHFLVEPLAWSLGNSLPRLSAIRYEPEGSIEWDGNRLHYYVHEKPDLGVPILGFAVLVSEWLVFWAEVWLRLIMRLCLLPFLVLKKRVQNHFSSDGTDQA